MEDIKEEVVIKERKPLTKWAKLTIWISAFALFFLVLLGADIATKLSINAWLKVEGASYDFPFPFPFYIQLFYNEGMAFGIGADQEWARWLFMSVSLLMSGAGIAYFIISYKKETITFKFLLILCIAGAFGNLIDRFFFCLGVAPYQYGVIDWIRFTFWEKFATFNLADAYLVVGIIAMAIYLIVRAIVSSVKKKKAGEIPEERTNRILSRDEIEQIKLQEQAKKEQAQAEDENSKSQ